MTLFAPDRVRAHNATALPERVDPVASELRDDRRHSAAPGQSITVGIGDPGVLQERDAVPDAGTPCGSMPQTCGDCTIASRRPTASDGASMACSTTTCTNRRCSPDSGRGRPRADAAQLAQLRAGGGHSPGRLHPTARRWCTPAQGAFYGPHGLTSSMDNERVALGPPGLGRQSFAGTRFSIRRRHSACPAGPHRSGFARRFTGAVLMSILPALRASLTQPAGADGSVQRIQITKQASCRRSSRHTCPVPRLCTSTSACSANSRPRSSSAPTWYTGDSPTCRRGAARST